MKYNLFEIMFDESNYCSMNHQMNNLCVETRVSIIVFIWTLQSKLFLPLKWILLQIMNFKMRIVNSNTVSISLLWMQRKQFEHNQYLSHVKVECFIKNHKLMMLQLRNCRWKSSVVSIWSCVEAWWRGFAEGSWILVLECW